MEVTKEIWAKIHAQFKIHPLLLNLKLLADGYNLTYQTSLNTQNKVQIALFIDGTLNYSDYGFDEDEDNKFLSTEKGKKFGRKRFIKRYSIKDTAYLKIRYGKKQVAEKLKEARIYHVPIFFTTKQIQKILTETCTEIQIHPDFIDYFLKYY
ncbi:MAG: hypothetical protein RLZZ292_872 [Bacteroidota bacterium]|jgi:hypothetical protein